MTGNSSLLRSRPSLISRLLVGLGTILAGCTHPAGSATDGAISDGSVDLAALAGGDLARFDGPRPDIPPPPTESPIEELWQPNATLARIKSPGQRMHFSAGLPFRILADANDPNAWQCPPGHPPYVCDDSLMTFFLDGIEVGTRPPDPANQNLWELRLPDGLSEGEHVLTVRFTPHGAAAIDGLVPVYITVDPPPVRSKTVELTGDLVLSGSTPLDWTQTLVRGNGHKVTAAAGYSGNLVIANSFITGLANFDNQVGLDVTTTGAVSITDSVFEATAPLRLVVNGSGDVQLANNEFRSTNYVTFVSAEPGKSPILDLSGTTSGAKVFTGNNIGAGIVLITGMADWQIGGLKDSLGNVFLGPRCVLELDGASAATIQGNYFHHDYYGGFSQGFNLAFGNGSDGALAEHNVLHDGSWPLQSFGGEFRYNLLVNSGHDFVRSSQPGTKFHHNLFVHAQAPNSGFDGALFFYGDEQNLVFENNTIDAGGATGLYDAPAIVLASATVSLTSLRNNAFVHFGATSWGSKALISAGRSEATVSSPRIANADYNAWYNPLASASSHYMSGLISGTPGTHDVVDDPGFAGAVPQVPYAIDEGAVWRRTYGVSQVLGYYRQLYTPSFGSPLIDAGSDTGRDIGAIGAGTAHAEDLFGLVLDTN